MVMQVPSISGTGLFHIYNSNNSFLDGITLDVNGVEFRAGDLDSDNEADLNMTTGTIDISGGIINICDELDVANGTITISGGNLNIGAYTGSSQGTNAIRFDMDAGTLNLTSGTINIYGQHTSAAQI